MKKVAVVILNWNGQKLLNQFLPFLLKYTNHDGVEIVVADNGSTDDSVSFLKERYPSITLILLPENYGFAEGYNKALSQIEAEYFVLLNSDVEVSENWLLPIIDFLDNNPDIAGAQPKLLSQRNKEYFEYAGAAGGFIDYLGYPFCRGRIFNVVEKDEKQYDTVTDVFWITGACFIIRSQEYFAAGGLDPYFFAHMEEIDLCWRLNARGKRLICFPQSVVYHVGGATLAEESPRKTFLNFRNNLLMLYKNLPDGVVNKIICFRILLDYLAAVNFLISGKIKNAKAIFKAHSEFRILKRNYQKQRAENIEKMPIQDIKSIYNRSILAEFYLRGNKKFSRLNN